MTTTDLPIAPPPPPPLPKASTTKSRTRTRTQTSTSRTTRTATTSYTATKTCSVVPDGNGSTSGPNGTSILENDSPITPPGVDFTANTGGDGWDVGFTDDEARVINVYHHKVPMRVDCFLRDGTRCPGGFPTQFPGIVTSLQSRVMWDPVVPNRLWQWTMSNSSGVGYNSVTCVDLGALGSVPVLCGNFRMSRDQYGSRPGFGGSNQGPVGQPIVGTKIYAVGRPRRCAESYLTAHFHVQINNVDGFGLDDERNALHCFDTATMEPCPENPIPVKYPTGWRQQSVNTAWTRLIRGKIYIFQPGRTNVDYDLIACVDPNNDPSYECGGLWPVKVPAGAQSNGNTYSDLFPYRTSATIDSGVCIGGAMGVNASSPSPACFDLSGNFIKQLNTNFSPGLRWPGVSGDLLGTKIILPCGSGVCCFDMATDATCPNYPAYGFAPSSEIKDGYYRTYTIRKEKPDCWWANGDAGNIWTFNPQTATKGCGTLSSGAPDFATIQLQDADKCTQTLLSWNKWEFLGMKPPTATFTSVNVTFFDSGNVPLPGFSNLQLPPPTPVVDLSSLSPAQTGNTLNVKVTFNGLTGCQSVSCSFTSRVTYKTTQQICCP
ncbi:hypothetical protein DFJ74DRAFT_101131 [Hyaloraphidium curvatum]|nr:hypothetical protein DFJ74DRAFT_101131 [Hyaloraphidium curvatum]